MEPGKPLWNSLETAKIIVGVLTPISIAILGIVVTLSTNEENRAFQESQFNQTVARQDQADKAALQKEQQAQGAALAREKAAREEARLIREEAFKQAQAAQAQSDAREAAARSEARRETRLDRIFSMRHQTWQTLGAKAEGLRSSSTPLLWLQGADHQQRIGELRVAHRALVLEVRAASAYFSPEFVSSIGEWAELLRRAYVGELEPRFALPEAEEKYQRFLVYARRDLRLED